MSYPLPRDPALTLHPLLARRVELAVGCADCESVPKVEGAGSIFPSDGVQVQLMHEGTRVLAGGYYGAWQAEIIRRLGGHHEPQEELAVHAIVERLREQPSPFPSLVVELGAFWAYYSIWSMRALGSRAILVEPDLGNMAVGEKNLELNGLEAAFVHAAVGGPVGTSATFVWESDQREHTVPVITVESLLQAADAPAIDILFVDVQGAELDVLERSMALLDRQKIRFIVVSTHHHSISGDPLTHQRCLKLLNDCGLHIIAEHSVAESFSGDGLIAAGTFAADFDLVADISYARQRETLFGELEYDLEDAWHELRSRSTDPPPADGPEPTGTKPEPVADHPKASVTSAVDVALACLESDGPSAAYAALRERMLNDSTRKAFDASAVELLVVLAVDIGKTSQLPSLLAQVPTDDPAYAYLSSQLTFLGDRLARARDPWLMRSPAT